MLLAQTELNGQEVFPKGFIDYRGELSISALAKVTPQSETYEFKGTFAENSKRLAELPITPLRVKILFDSARDEGRVKEFSRFVKAWPFRKARSSNAVTENLSLCYAAAVTESYFDAVGRTSQFPTLRFSGDFKGLRPSKLLHQNLALVATGQNNLGAELRPVIAECKKLHPDEPFFAFALAQEYTAAYRRSGDKSIRPELNSNYPLVLATCEAALKRWPDRSVFHLYAGIALKPMKRYDEALRHLYVYRDSMIRKGGTRLANVNLRIADIEKLRGQQKQ
ncbi:MAG: hypothetical protein WCK51_09055 [Armatimonadota bacterium]